MSFEGSFSAIDYYPCRYGRSRMVFRGPKVPLDGPYTVVLGGSETYGKYVEETFSDMLADRTGRRVLNLGLMNAGVDAFLLDAPLMKVVSGAQVVVVQAMGAHNLSNRFYTVHPRRNDRFLRHSAQMERLFPEVDFSEFVFTRHMLTGLHAASTRRFGILLRELRATWVSRMQLLLSRCDGQKVLLFVEGTATGPLGAEPLFVTVEMLQALEGAVDKAVQCDVRAVQADGMVEMLYPETERAMAERMLNGPAHAEIGEALARAIRRPDGRALRNGAA